MAGVIAVSFSVMTIGCGEGTTRGTDAGTTTPFGDSGRATSSADAGNADAGFMWVDPSTDYDAGWVFTTFGDGGTDGGFEGRCAMTMCLTGETTRDSASNEAFNAICDSSLVPGLIRSCDPLNCHNTFNTTTSSSGAIYQELFKVLDTNGDNVVNAKDRGCGLNLLGFSWGGVTAVDVATHMANDTRIEPFYRRVHRLVVMDPYQPLKTFIPVPPNVWRFVEYRHSSVPSNDCSNSALLGPYKGLPPRCAAYQSCRDYDYSMAPTQQYPNTAGTLYLGSSIGHCTVPEVAAPAIFADFRSLGYAFMPPSQPVALP